MPLKLLIACLVALFTCAGLAHADPIAGFDVLNVPVQGRVPATAGLNIKVCVGTTLTFKDASTSPSNKFYNIQFAFDNPYNYLNGYYGNGASIGVQFYTTGKITVTQIVTDANNKANADTLKMTVEVIADTKPDASFSLVNQQCGSQNFTYKAAANGLDYTWKFDGSSTTTSTGQTTTIQFDKATGDGKGKLYNVSLTVSDQYGCSTTLTKQQPVDQVPDINITSPNAGAPPGNLAGYFNAEIFTLCSAVDSSLKFVNSSTKSTNTSYQIVWGNGTPDFNATVWSQADTIVKVFREGYDTLQATVKGTNGCSLSKQYIIYRGKIPSNGFSSPKTDPYYCIGDHIDFSFGLDDLSNAKGTIYKIGISETPHFDTVINQASIESGTYKFVHYYYQSSCNVNDPNEPGDPNSFPIECDAINACGIKTNVSRNIHISAKPAVYMSAPQTVCDSTVTNLTDATNWAGVYPYCGTTPPNQNSSEVWSITPPPGGKVVVVSGDTGNLVLPKDGTRTVGVKLLGPGTYKIRLYVKSVNAGTADCVRDYGSNFGDFQICVRAKPAPGFRLDKKAACTPAVINVTNAVDSTIACGNDSYHWVITPIDSVDNCTQNGNGAINDENAQKPVFTFSEPGRYRVRFTATATGSGCSNFIDDTVRIYQKAGLAFAKFPALCAGDSIKPVQYISSIDTCFSNGNIKYTWGISNTTPVTSSKPNPGSITYAKDGKWYIGLTLNNGCGDTTVHDSIIVNKIIVISPGHDTSICSGNAVNITPASPNGLLTYYWQSILSAAPGSITGNTNNTSGGGSASINDVLINAANPPDTASVKYLIYAGSGSCKSNTDTVKVTVLPADTAYAGPDAFICRGVTQYTMQARPSKFVKDTGTWSQLGTLMATITDKHNPASKVTGLAEGNIYTFVWTLPGKSSKCGILSDTVYISTKPIVNIIDTPGPICGGTALTINGQQPTGGDGINYSYQWLQSSDGATFNPVTGANQQSITIASPVNNDYYMRQVKSQSCTELSDTVKVTIVTAVPEPHFIAIDSVGCASLQNPLQSTFTNQTPGKDQFSYTWRFGNGNTSTLADPGTQSFPTTVSGYGDTTYYVTLTATNGCVNVDYKDSIVVKSQPAVLFTADRVLGCSDSSITFTNISVKPGSNAVYAWDFGDGTQLTSGARTVQHTYHNGPPTTYKVTLSGNNDCGNHTSGPLLVTIDSNRIGLYVDVNSTELFICSGDTVHFHNKSSGATEFRWDFGDKSPLITTTDSIGTQPHRYSNAGIYTVNICANNYCVADTCTTLTINVGQRPTAAFSLLPDTVCAGQPVQFNNNSTTGSDISYSWNFGDTTAGSNDYSTAHTYTSGGLFTTQLVVNRHFNIGFPPDFSCPDTAYATVTVDNPSGTLVYATDTLCSGQQLTFTVQSNTTRQYHFIFGDGTDITTSNNIVTHIYRQPGKYTPYAELTGFSGKCATIIPGPDTVFVDGVNASFYFDSIPYCDSTILTLTGNASAYFGIKQYNWTVNGNDYTGSNPSVTLTQSTNYNIKVFATANSGCTADTSALVEVYVHQSPVGQIAINSDSCSRDSVHFSASVFANDPVAYAWDFGNGDHRNGKDAATVYNPAGLYIVSLTSVTSFGCTNTISRPVTIKASPVINVTRDSVRICRGDSVTLNASASVQIPSWSWSPAGSLGCTDCSNPVANPVTTTLYTVTGTNSQGCSGTHQVLVNVVQPLHVTASPPSYNVCLPNTTLPTIQFFAAGAYNYTWSPGTWLNNNQVFNPIVTLPDTIQAGTQIVYRVTGYDQYNCFTDTADVLLSVGLYPTVELGMGDSGVAGRKVIIHPQVTNGPFKKFTWSVISGQGSVDCMGDPACAEPQLTINSTIAFKVVAENTFGCTASDTIYYKAFCSGNEQLFLPTGFSPDNDGINDVLMVQGRGIIIEEFKVLNRWGQLIFNGAPNTQPNIPAYGWDGSVNGNKSNPAPPDVYVYFVKVKCTASNEEFTIKNNVTLIRVKR
ncbi:MAG TPA: PKD domain-containing protein [Chitinophagaceae bacterium]|nr:PKD domain-containing protein [Chitinophagaceae bacterium]